VSALPVPGESAATPLAPSLNATKWRARSLVALGHSPARLARALGTSRTTVNRILLGQDWDPGVILRQRIRHLWESWWSLVPPERTAGERRAASLARRRAGENNWPCPAGLDDEHIDTVAGYRPHCGWRQATGTGVAADDPLGLAARRDLTHLAASEPATAGVPPTALQEDQP